MTEATDFEKDRNGYARYSLGFLGTDINLKFGLISMVNILVQKMKKKRPSTTHYEVLSNLAKGTVMTDFEVRGIAVVCEDFGFECTEFPDFGIDVKEMPKKIHEILATYLPF